jgi:hypothetical protein
VSLDLQLVVVRLSFCLFFLGVAELATVVQLVNYDLLDVSLVEFGVGLNAED